MNSEKTETLERPALAGLRVHVPSGAAAMEVVKPATRVATLEAKRIALQWNEKQNGQLLLAEVAQQLSARYRNSRIVNWPNRYPYKAGFQRLMQEQPADAVVLSLGD
ncbi:MAG: hypothetical protein HY673_17540 [Chloroflexi bacterium]|nr:hypothetical protein [Chloroflexota bacterium]